MKVQSRVSVQRREAHHDSMARCPGCPSSQLHQVTQAWHGDIVRNRISVCYTIQVHKSNDPLNNKMLVNVNSKQSRTTPLLFCFIVRSTARNNQKSTKFKLKYPFPITHTAYPDRVDKFHRRATRENSSLDAQIATLNKHTTQAIQLSKQECWMTMRQRYLANHLKENTWSSTWDLKVAWAHIFDQKKQTNRAN